MKKLFAILMTVVMLSFTAFSYAESMGSAEGEPSAVSQEEAISPEESVPQDTTVDTVDAAASDEYVTNGYNEALWSIWKVFNTANYIVAILFFVFYFYQLVYIPISIFKKEKPLPKAEMKNRYAAMICARNESSVIRDLIASLQKQTYPADKIDIFVMADNCTDNTADIARSMGVHVYERQNKELVGKGYALNQLMQNMKVDFPEGFDGYFVFDADNIISPNYIENMNDTFCSGKDIVTGYRNSKNYGSNWISSGYAMWFLHDCRYLSQPRSLLNLSCAVSGTGFLFSRKIAEEMGGWPFHTLVEDTEFTCDFILRGYKIGYCSKAELYDEQPVKFRQSWRQRLRWSRGFLQILNKYGKQLFKGIFTKGFSCYDIAMTVIPAYVLAIISIFNFIGMMLLSILNLFNGLGDSAHMLAVSVSSIFTTLCSVYVLAFIMGVTTLITEWKHVHTSTFKKILYLFTFPSFMITYAPITFHAMFAKNLGWKPIQHTISLEMMQKSGMADGMGLSTEEDKKK